MSQRPWCTKQLTNRQQLQSLCWCFLFGPERVASEQAVKRPEIYQKRGCSPCCLVWAANLESPSVSLLRLTQMHLTTMFRADKGEFSSPAASNPLGARRNAREIYISKRKWADVQEKIEACKKHSPDARASPDFVDHVKHQVIRNSKSRPREKHRLVHLRAWKRAEKGRRLTNESRRHRNGKRTKRNTD